MFDLIAGLLAWLYELWPSYGGAIILLTMIIMTGMAPVTVRQTRSMLAMQRLQPEMKRLRAKHGSDREKLNQEMMALYQANGVNPLGGCLPVLIQMPIFLVLFQVVRGLTRRVSEVGLSLGQRSITDSGAIVEFADRTFNPNFIGPDTQMALDLTAGTEMSSLGLDLSESARSALGDSLLTGLPYLLLVISVGVTTWYQQRQIQGRQKNSEINPQQQMIMKVLPFMLPVFSFGFPAALVVYWFVSNVFRVGQQVFITRKFYGDTDDEVEVIRPETVEEKQTASQTERKGSTRTKTSGGGHGRRSPVSRPAPKKKRKPASETKPKTKPAAKRSTPQPRERQERATSKRVTPKKGSDSTKSSRRRDKKRR